MKTVITAQNKKATTLSVARVLQINKDIESLTTLQKLKEDFFVVEKGGTDVYNIIGIMKTTATKSGWAFKAQKFSCKATFAWTLQAGETVFDSYAEAKVLANENKFKKLVTYFK